MDFFFPDGSGIFQGNNAKIQQALAVLAPLRVFVVKGKD